MYNTIYKGFSKSIFLLAAIWMLFAFIPVHAQSDTAKVSGGVVIDQYGTPVPGVEVSVKDKRFQVVTKEDGSFDLDFKQGDILTFSHTSYLYKEEKVKKADAGKVLKIRLDNKRLKDEEAKTLDALYRKVDKESFLGAVATIYTDQLTTTLASNITAALPGRMQGLYTSQNFGINLPYINGWGDPNAAAGMLPDNNYMFSLSSRGTTPVVYVDGVQRDFTSVDPEGIESVSIQKDALSGIMLGGRSSNSVLLITTKEPVKSGFQLSFTGKYGVQKPVKMPDPLSADQYSYLLNEALTNEGNPPVYTYNDFEAYRTGSDPYGHPNVNWYDQVLDKSSPIQSYTLNATGGNDIVQYFINLGYFNEEGLFKTSSQNSYNTNYSYDRYLITSKINVKVTDDLKVGATILGRIQNDNQPGGSGGGMFNILTSLYNTTPNNAYPVYNANGSYGGNQSFPVNLLANTLGSGYASSNARDAMANVTVNYDLHALLKGLSFSAQGNITTQSRSSLMRYKQSQVFQYKGIDENGKLLYQSYGTSVPQSNDYVPVSNAQQMYGQLAFNYKTNIRKHGINAMLLGDVQEVLINYLLPKKFGNINGRVDYDFDKRYFVQAAISETYYNRFAPDEQWGTFYAFGLGWDVSREKFMAGLDWLNQLKFRGVYGKTGNLGGSEGDNYFTWREGYVGGNAHAYGSYGFGTSGGVIESVYEFQRMLVNKHMTYEKAHKVNVGTDIAVLNNTIKFNADFYHDNYYDLLMTRGKSTSLAGLYYPLENIGKVLRKGAELAITYQDHIADFNYFITANWTREQSELVFIDEQEQLADNLKRTGKPAGTMFGLICDGFFQSQEEINNSALIPGQTIRPGDLKYRDMPNKLDANGNLVGDGVIDQYDLVPVGFDKPLKYFGLNFGFEYRGIEFSMLWQGAYDRDIYLSDSGTWFISGFQQVDKAYGQAYTHLLGRWTPETAETATFPRLKPNGNTYNNSPLNGYNSFWVRSGNYIRLKNVSVGYSLPDSFCRNHFGGVRVKLFVDGQNLLTKAACSLVDPEVMDFSNYPMLKGFNFGVNVKF